MHEDAKFVELLMQRGEGPWGARTLAFCQGLEATGWSELLCTDALCRIFVRKGAAVCVLPVTGSQSPAEWLDSRVSISKRVATKVLLLGINQRDHCWSEAELETARRKKGSQSITLGSVSLQDLTLRVPAARSEWEAFIDQARRILAVLDDSPVAKDPTEYKHVRAREMERQRDYELAARGRGWVTRGFVACGLLSYLISLTVNGSVAWKMARLGAILPGLSRGQESWRLATAPWVVPDFWLLAIFLLYLLDMGLLLERVIGGGAILALLVASALAGGLAGSFWSPWVALGSGNALVAGLCSASLLLSWLWRGRLPRIVSHRLRDGTHHGLAFVVFTFCLQNHEVPLFMAGFSAGLIMALAICLLRRWLRLGWVCLAFPIWGLLGMGLSWNHDISPFSFPRKVVEMPGGTSILLPAPFRADQEGSGFRGPGGFLWFYTLEKPEGDVVAALEERSKAFGQPIKHLPGGVWTVASLPRDEGFTQVGVFGYCQGKLLLIKAGSTVGDEVALRDYLWEVLEFTQGRVQLPPEAHKELPRMNHF